MDDRCRVNSLVELPNGNPVDGTVRWDPVHSIWQGTMLAVAVIGGPFVISWSAMAVFILLTGSTLLLGHSVGFHRRLIHRSFQCALWLERFMVWCGTCVGMGGPLWMIRTHDLRDWAQRQPRCHDYLAHRTGLLRDYWWQVHCRLVLRHPPRFNFERAGQDRFYRFLENCWMAQQLPIAALLYALGGWGWVFWGVCARVAVSATGHWFIGHLAHTRGPQTWLVAHAGVQAHDVPWAALPTMGEAWHNNHHAYPGSAKMGLEPGQIDPGWWLIVALRYLGLAWEVVTPEVLSRQGQLVRAPGYLESQPPLNPRRA